MLGLQSLSSFELGQRRSLTLENCMTAIDRCRSLLPLCWNMLGNARGTQPKQRKRIIMQVAGIYTAQVLLEAGIKVWFGFRFFIIVYHKGGIEKCQSLYLHACPLERIRASNLAPMACPTTCAACSAWGSFTLTLQLLLLMWHAALMSPDKILLLWGRLGGPSPVLPITLLAAPLIILLWLDE